MSAQTFYPVPRNSRDGVALDKRSAAMAFAFFDGSGNGSVTAAAMHSKLAAFYDEDPEPDEVQQLCPRGEMTLDELEALVKDNELVDFDPVREAFRLYDPEDLGYVDPECLRLFMSNLGFQNVTDEDIEVLIETADVDGDGKIGLEDFRGMMDYQELQREKELALAAESAAREQAAELSPSELAEMREREAVTEAAAAAQADEEHDEEAE